MKVTLLFTTSDWWVSKLICFFTNASVSHVAICFDDPDSQFANEVYEAAWCGFRMSTRAKLTSGTARIVDAVEVPIQPVFALALCRTWLECPYDYAGLVGEVWVRIGRLLGRRWDNPFAGAHTMFCSEAATYLLQLSPWTAKRPTLALVPRTTDPEMLLDTLTGGAHAR